ncbi:hypothetical protein [Vreelandella nigrificans]|uniref:Uncharacterized protein n=1 Tax=Vreelandella nigrificans TaxID=2042704 RepID=A0A2A4HJI7_9GAMM|nr:hypothetical protein [Halomonas nigrificans]PCF94940.1 hypothetical protein CPA45_15125 [Halomonas nigrificans]
MDTASISNIVLSILTAVYVVLTFRILKENRRNNELGSYPQLYCEVKVDGSEARLSVINRGNVPALDIGALVLAHYHEDDQDVMSFLNEFVGEGWPERKRIVNTFDGFYSVYDNFGFPVVPAGKQVSVRPGFPKMADQYLLLFQFRNIFGENFFQIYWFHLDHRNRHKGLTLGSVEPHGIARTSRITFTENYLLADKNSQLPACIEKNFSPFFKCSIPSGITAAGILNAHETREVWSDA